MMKVQGKYTTSCTYLGHKLGYGCRIFYNGKLYVEARCNSRLMVGPTFRDLFRTIDKFSSGSNSFTGAVRCRKFKEGNLSTSVRHIWHI